MNRLADLGQFYDLLAHLEKKLGGKRCLAECRGRADWPRRGVYFFFENGEHRSKSGDGMRVVRVGTHALKAGSKSKLWKPAISASRVSRLPWRESSRFHISVAGR